MKTSDFPKAAAATEGADTLQGAIVFLALDQPEVEPRAKTMTIETGG
jgi:hypothetical protein